MEKAMENNTALQAIEESILRDMTVIIPYTEDDYATLVTNCDDDCDGTENTYWGTDEDGNRWTVKLD